MERESGRRNRKGEEVSRVGSSKKNREANGEGRQRWPWVKGRVVSSGIRSRERITCYPTSPTGIDLTTETAVGKRVLLPISSDPSSNVFSAALYLHVYFSPASATIPDVVETNSSRLNEN